MDLKRKDEIARSAILSISRHDDEDAAVRNAALDRLTAIIIAEKVGIAERNQARLAELFGETEAD